MTSIQKINAIWFLSNSKNLQKQIHFTKHSLKFFWNEMTASFIGRRRENYTFIFCITNVWSAFSNNGVQNTLLRLENAPDGKHMVSSVTFVDIQYLVLNKRIPILGEANFYSSDLISLEFKH